MKNNFTQALKELTGFDEDNNPKSSAFSESSDTEFNEPYFKTEICTFKDYSQNTEKDCTRLSSTMIVEGEVKSDDTVFVNGELIGNIRTSSDINISNLVIGNISAQNVLLRDGRIKGDVTLGGDLSVGENSVVVGDIKCQNLEVSGKIKGNCQVEDSAMLSNTAYMVCDITASSIASQQGAKIIGTVTTTSIDPAAEAEFDFGGEF